MLDQIIEKGKKTVAIGLTATMLYGCVPAQNISEELPERSFRGYICNKVEDADNSGYVGDSEEDFINEKKHFSKGERINVAAVVCGHKGSTLTTRIVGPDGNLKEFFKDKDGGKIYGLFREELKSECYVIGHELESNLITPGEYTVRWEINGVPFKSKIFSVF